MKLVFMHGWGFDSDIWTDVINMLFRIPAETGIQEKEQAGLLPAQERVYEMLCLDLGFTNKYPVNETLPDGPYVAIGHSMGSMWHLRHKTEYMKGFISICGFDRLAKYTPPGILEAMIARLDVDPYKMMCDFWPHNYLGEGDLSIARLKLGLEWLVSWDESQTRSELNCPALALASTRDPIIPKSMTEDIWPHHIVKWHNSDDHFLPLTRPDWCAAHIQDFLNANDV